MKKISKILIHLSILSIILLSTVATVHAEIGDYTVLVPLPGLQDDTTKTTTLEKYLPNAFNLAIGVSAVMAFVMITLGGITYATTDAMFKKDEGRKFITDAIAGLLLVIGAWIILFTINPKILKFDLTIDNPNVKAPPSTVESGGGGGSSETVSCTGTCPYSYTNTDNDIVKYKDCSNCVNAEGTRLAIKTKTIDGKPAQINSDLANSLIAVKANSSSPAFEITETWPPTVNHSAQGQYDGTSVDLTIDPPNPETVRTFMNNSQTNGLRVVYEVSDVPQTVRYVNAGIPVCTTRPHSNCVLPLGRITGEHFSVYKR